jgi:hypothetical protein
MAYRTIGSARLSRGFRTLVRSEVARRDTPQNEALRLACQVLVRAVSKVAVEHLEGPAAEEIRVDLPLLPCMERAGTVAAAYGLQARVS